MTRNTIQIPAVIVLVASPWLGKALALVIGLPAMAITTAIFSAGLASIVFAEFVWFEK